MNSIISFIRRKILRIPADRWNYQYQRGEWNGLGQETARFDAVVKRIAAGFTSPSILEIGCGPALMLQRMDGVPFTRFTGVDLSDVAIESAKKYENDHIDFVTADMQTFVPTAAYDVIVFNESLYYAKDTLRTFERYIQYLKPGGSIIVTAFEHKHTAHLWPSVESKWKPVRSEVVSAGAHKWSVRIYKPSVA